MAILFALLALGLAACGDDESSLTTAPEAYRLDLGSGVVVAFVKGQSPYGAGKVAYVTHVPSGTQAVVDGEGRVMERHDGRDDGPSRLDVVLADESAMSRITGGIQNEEEPQASRRVEMIEWTPLFQFGGIKYVKNWKTDEGVLTVEDLTELYRVAFKIDEHAGSNYLSQDGDATYLEPGTSVYAVKGYLPSFRLATVEDSEVTIYEVGTNPQAKIGEDLLDIRDKVKAIDILSEEDSTTVLGAIAEESAVGQFVEAVLASPVDQDRDRDGERYFLGFRLADGTSVVRGFWMEPGLLSRGIVTGPAVSTLVRSALEKEEGTPSASRQWGGGTGIQVGTPSAAVQQSDTGDRIQLPQAVEQALGAQPSPDWTLVEGRGMVDQPGFSLRLPDGWELRETKPLDSYVGELVGDDVTLRFDYGRFSPMLNPAGKPETIYVLSYEDIGGYEAKLVIPLKDSGRLTGVHFRAMDGLRLTIWGEDLTPEQQRTAFAIFRSIRSANSTADGSSEEPGASTSTSRLVIRRGPMSVIHEGIDYEAVAGPIREELLDVDRLELTQLALDNSGLRGSKGGRVYLLPGVPLEQGFLVRSTEKGMYSDIWYLDPETAYPVCQPGARNVFYVAEGASPTPASARSTDTPTTTTDLSSEGLLDAGWPLVDMASLQIEFRGVEYNYVDHSHFGGFVPIEELETLVIDYNVDVGRLPSPALEEITTGATVQDRIRIHRLTNRPVNEVILVDQCPGDLHGHQFVFYRQTGLHRKHTSEAPKLANTPTPEPLQPGAEGSMPPDHVRLDLDPKVVVAFVDDDDRGRIAYVTHVPTGAQAILNKKSEVIERHAGTGIGDAVLEATLSDAEVAARIESGLLSEEVLPGKGFMDWINFVRFGGISYSSKVRRGGGDQVEKSRLGDVLYRVAFHVDANLVPGSYRPRDGDDAFLPPGTPIHSVDGYSPSEVLAAVVDGEAWLFRRSGPAASNPTPTPAVASGAKDSPHTGTPPPEYSAAELAGWYESLQEVVWDVPGVWSTNRSERKNRIEIGLRPLRGGRERLEVAVKTLGVPLEAVEIEVGCKGMGGRSQQSEDASENPFIGALDYSLDVVSQVPYGETVRMKLRLMNMSNEPVKVALGGRPAYDFLVTTTAGEGIWKWKCGGVTLDILEHETLEPGESLEFIGEWEEVDNQGEPVPAGTYVVRGFLDVGLPNSGPPGSLVTEAHELEVIR